MGMASKLSLDIVEVGPKTDSESCLPALSFGLLGSRCVCICVGVWAGVVHSRPPNGHAGNCEATGRGKKATEAQPQDPVNSCGC